MSIGSIVGNVASGGVIGMIGSLGSAAVTYVSDRALAKEKLKQVTIDNEHELQILGLNQDRERQAAEESHALEELKGSFEGLQKSIDDQITLSGKADSFVVDILALFRPGLTVLLMVLAVIFVLMHTNDLAQQALELVGMAVAWWFGDRQRNKLGVK